MSVRRLAAEQPASFAFTPENLAWAQTQIDKFPAGRQASAVIPLLWRAQEQHQYWLPKPAIEYVGRMLDMPYIRVLEVATFYTMFNLEPVGQHYVQLCGTTPCRLRGAEDIINVCKEPHRRPGACDAGRQLFSWLEVECLGACCNAPMVQINNDYYEDLTPESFNKLLDDLAAGRPVKKGPQSARHTSEPEGDVKTLQDPALYDGSVVGAWHKRFAEEEAKAKEAAAAAAAEKAAPKRQGRGGQEARSRSRCSPRPAKPDDTHPQTAAADTPAHRVAQGKEPVSAADKAKAADPDMKLSDSPTAKLPDAPTQDRPSSFVATPGEGESTKQPAAKKTTRKKADPAPGSDGSKG